MKTKITLLSLFVFAILAISPIAFAEEMTTDLGDLTGQTVTDTVASTSAETTATASTGAETTTGTETTTAATEPAQTASEPTEATAVTAEVTPQEANEIVANATGVNESEMPSVTPDQPIRWGLKRSLERIEYLISIGKAAKARKGLEHARERHLEVMKMIAEKKLDKADKAETARQEILARTKTDISAVSESDPETESELTGNLESEIKEQDDQATRFKGNINLRFKGQLTTEQQARIDSLVAALRESNADVQVSIKEKRARTDVKLKVRTAEEKVDTAKEKISDANEKASEARSEAKTARTTGKKE